MATRKLRSQNKLPSLYLNDVSNSPTESVEASSSTISSRGGMLPVVKLRRHRFPAADPAVSLGNRTAIKIAESSDSSNGVASNVRITRSCSKPKTSSNAVNFCVDDKIVTGRQSATKFTVEPRTQVERTKIGREPTNTLADEKKSKDTRTRVYTNDRDSLPATTLSRKSNSRNMKNINPGENKAEERAAASKRQRNLSSVRSNNKEKAASKRRRGENKLDGKVKNDDNEKAMSDIKIDVDGNSLNNKENESIEPVSGENGHDKEERKLEISIDNSSFSVLSTSSGPNETITSIDSANSAIIKESSIVSAISTSASHTQTGRQISTANNSGHDSGHVTSTVCDSLTESQRFVDIIEKVLVEKYLNVTKRMNVPHQPLCLNKLEDCIAHHKKNFKINVVDEHAVDQLRILVRTNKPTIFLRVIINNMLQKLFPDKTVILLLLEHILAINKPEDDEYTPDSVKEIAATAFAKIIERFPPCCAPCKGTYRSLIASPLGDKTKLPADKFNPKLSLLENILKILELVIKQGEIINGNVSLNESEDFSDFLRWSEKTDQKYSFEKLTRDEKVERVFLVLNLLLQLMETDLTMTMIIHADDPHTKIVKQQKHPLIGFYLWNDDTYGEVNYKVTNILNMFVWYVSIEFAHHKIGYLARLINLIYHAVYLSEDNEKGNLRYPHIQNHCKILCDALNKSIEGNQAYSTKLYLNVIEHLQTPPLKLMLCTKFLNKLNKKSIALCPRSIYDLIIDGDYLEIIGDQPMETFEEEQLNESQEAMVSFSQHYPFVEATKRHQTSDLSAEEYIGVLHTAFEAYLIIHHIPDIISAYQNKDVDEMALLELKYGAAVKKHEEMANQTVDYDELEAELRANPNSFRENAHNCPIFSFDVINQKYKQDLIHMINIHLNIDDIRRYREDIKYHDEIKNIVPQAKNGFFSNWFK